jgi:hypothetical protein
MIRTIALILALAAGAGTLAAQAITFTGDVGNDFPIDSYLQDPGGVDVGMPAPLVAAGLTVSGWDIQGVGISYDGASDTLFFGIDTFGIAGDADGDGDPGSESAIFQQIGGIDWPDFGGNEYFTVAFDFNDDGLLDVICGLPPGQDISGFTCALYDNNAAGGASSSFLHFGAPIPACVGIAPASPTAAAPDLQFTIPNFSTLTAMFGVPGVTNFALHVFLGSQEDGGIGEDYIPFISASLGQGPSDCIPVPNNYELVSTTDLGGPVLAKTRLGLLNTYGACVFFSQVQSPVGIPIVELPGVPELDIGIWGTPASVMVVDAAIPLFPRPPVSCYDMDFIVPAFVPPGTTIYAQCLSYPMLDVTETYYMSNVVTYVHPMPGGST